MAKKKSYGLKSTDIEKFRSKLMYRLTEIERAARIDENATVKNLDERETHNAVLRAKKSTADFVLQELGI